MKQTKRRIREPIVVGWREWAALPALGVARIKVKVDTGARTSSLHAFHIRDYEREGIDVVEFRIHPEQRRRLPEIVCVHPIHDRRRVASSNGQSQERIVIQTEVELGGQSWSIELTLANRDEMGFRMLLGREALRGRATVDPSRSYRTGEPKS